ncbi:MAG: hypothetical protein ACI4JB_08160 [Porcipelethomonas sp.]
MKNNILDIFETIYEAHKIIRDFIKEENFENAKSVLIDCQSSALQVGKIIENSEGSGFITVGILEEYCKYVYQIFMSIADECNGREIKRELDKRLDRVKKSVKDDIKVKLEIVFLPYKASMWDSLESVWKAADEDPDCDAYVVPIPYYDRNPDHSFGQFHYEGCEYPGYVPITDYRKYDIKNRKPDVIYIHNPYDDCNYVTSVDPRFYSRELKKYTDKLVYVPYFVLAELNPDDPEIIAKYSHFATVPGVINADNVIVQSEGVRQVYIKALLPYVQNNTVNQKILEDKILGLGSPKFDAISNKCKDDIEIPEKWNKIIKKTDGSYKKIVFFNTSIGALLEHNEEWVKKIHNALNGFFRNKDEIALLWRPHPLIKATIQSMRSSLWNEYSKIVDEYISDGWGIYDDTPDLQRAVVLSDVYYGDGSSVAKLFRIKTDYVYSQWRMNVEDFIDGLYEYNSNKNNIQTNYGKNIYIKLNGI